MPAERIPRRRIVNSHGAWQRVVFAVDCEPDGLCPVCDIDYAECPCPGPTMNEEYDYREVNGVLWARARNAGPK